MDRTFNTSTEVVDINIEGNVLKTTVSGIKTMFYGLMAGIFVALGAVASNVAVHTITDVGTAKVVAGIIFPIGLIMIIFISGELFTGNCLMCMAVWDKKITIGKMIRNLTIVYFSNLPGVLLIVGLVFLSGQFDYTSGALGAYTIKVAITKTAIAPISAIASGILCNILVCVAVLMAQAAVDAAGKICAIFFPIFTFVIGGFEHCIANMYYIPAGILAATNSRYVEKAQELYGITAEQLATLKPLQSLHNLIPVTIGNIIGGVFLGGLFFAIHKVSRKKQK